MAQNCPRAASAPSRSTGLSGKAAACTCQDRCSERQTPSTCFVTVWLETKQGSGGASWMSQAVTAAHEKALNAGHAAVKIPAGDGAGPELDVAAGACSGATCNTAAGAGAEAVTGDESGCLSGRDGAGAGPGMATEVRLVTGRYSSRPTSSYTAYGRS